MHPDELARRRYQLCCCGRPLHYMSEASEAAVSEMVALLGPTVPVVVAGQAYEVPRHYIALHGLAARDLPQLAVRYGWARVS